MFKTVNQDKEKSQIENDFFVELVHFFKAFSKNLTTHWGLRFLAPVSKLLFEDTFNIVTSRKSINQKCDNPRHIYNQ